MEGGLADPDHGAGGARAGCVEAGVAETGDDVGVDAVALGAADHVEHAGDGVGLVDVALDRDRALAGVLGQDARARRGGGASGSADLGRHGGGGVRVDDEEAHQTSPAPASEPCRERRRCTSVTAASASTMTRKETPVVTVPSA